MDWTGIDVPTPALVLDRGALVDNLERMRELTRRHGVELWPHGKTHRMAELGRLQRDLGADGLTVAKLGEAEAFADAGIDRIFVAYPVIGQRAADRALALHRRIDLRLGVDGLEAALSLGEVFAAAQARARVLLGIDTGLGREGVPVEDAPALARRIAELPGVELVGIYTHEGSVYSSTDRSDLVRRSIGAATSMVGVASSIRADGIDLREVSLGSSAAAAVVAEVPGVTQVRPGIYAVNDLGQIALGNADIDSTAIRVVATVCSRTAPDRGCIDAGAKALGSDLILAASHREEFPGHGLIVGHPGWVIDRLSEEHGWLRWTGEGIASDLPVGARVEIVPTHACMVFAALRRAHVVTEGGMETWDGFGPGSST
ncbi:alanine racemase [Schumannella luteola]|jgi:D-serine deaminase-like pyridoxal phosphate-dependent protein